MWIEVWIKNDHSIRRVQVDADAPRARSKDVYKDVGVGLIKFIHAFLSNALLRVTVLDTKSANSRCEELTHTSRKYL